MKSKEKYSERNIEPAGKVKVSEPEESSDSEESYGLIKNIKEKTQNDGVKFY